MKTDQQRIAELELALGVAMKFVADNIGPMDSISAPDWFVAVAAVSCDLQDPEGKTTACLKEVSDLPEGSFHIDHNLEVTFEDADDQPEMG
jgi:hypothetical protein